MSITMRRHFLVFILIFCLCNGYAQSSKTRSGTYTYVVPDNQSLDVAKKAALEKAKLQILEDEFGTVVGVSNISRTSNVNGTSSSNFLSIGETEVKGEWLGTVGTPTFEISYQQGMLTVKVSVTGKIREIEASTIEIIARVLRNGTDLRCESDTLKDGDDIFVYFKAPCKGYVSVYQYDSDGVFRLLPYPESAETSMSVKGGTEYIFFDRTSSKDGVSEVLKMVNGGRSKSNYNIACNYAEDLCRYYIVFSRNQFVIANDTIDKDGKTPATLDFESFQKWLSRSRKLDRDMTVAVRDVILKKKLN